MSRRSGPAARAHRVLAAVAPAARDLAAKVAARRAATGSSSEPPPAGATGTETDVATAAVVEPVTQPDPVTDSDPVEPPTVAASSGAASSVASSIDDSSEPDVDAAASPDWTRDWDPFASWSPDPTIPAAGEEPAPRSRLPRVDRVVEDDVAELSPPVADAAVPRLPAPTTPAIPPPPLVRRDVEPSEPLLPGAPLGWEPQEVDPRGLLSAKWARVGVLVAQASLPPAVILGRTLAAIVLVALTAALATWSWFAAENARRAKPRTSLRAAQPAPGSAAWWVVPAAYTLGALGVSALFDRWAGPGRSTTDRDVILFVVRSTLVLGGVAAWYWPFGRLVTIARWVGASGIAVRKWFWATVAVSVLTGVLLVLVHLSVLGDFGADVEPSALVVVLTWLAITAPVAIGALTGQRAMLQIEGGARETFLKRSMPPIDPSELLARRARLFEGDDVDAAEEQPVSSTV